MIKSDNTKIQGLLNTLNQSPTFQTLITMVCAETGSDQLLVRSSTSVPSAGWVESMHIVYTPVYFNGKIVYLQNKQIQYTIDLNLSVNTTDNELIKLIIFEACNGMSNSFFDIVRSLKTGTDQNKFVNIMETREYKNMIIANELINRICNEINKKINKMIVNDYNYHMYLQSVSGHSNNFINQYRTKNYA